MPGSCCSKAPKKLSVSRRKWLVVIGEDVSSDTREAVAGDVFRDGGPDGEMMRFVELRGDRTSVRKVDLCDLDPRDWPPDSYPARIVEVLDIFEKIGIDSVVFLRRPSLISRLSSLQRDFATDLYDEAANEVGAALKILKMSHTDFREYRMLPRYFCRSLGKAFLLWSKSRRSIQLPTVRVASP